MKDKNQLVVEPQSVLSEAVSGAESQINKNLHINYHSSFVLTTDKGIYLTEAEARQIIVKAFQELANRYPHALPIQNYLSHGRAFDLGTYFQRDNKRNYLIPTFNGGAVTFLKCEFTSYIGNTYVINEPPRPRKIRQPKKVEA
ncbi:MAG: hypothetical protein WC375_00200 [Methanomassiliicoccales archaeon]|jgi:hypothetical protein